jgi:hypothetical protein
MDICNAAYRDRIAQILNLAVRVGECRPQGKVVAVRIARPREVDPVTGYLLSQLGRRLSRSRCDRVGLLAV